MPGHSLTELISRCHREIREIFSLHQEALILGEFSQALVLFQSYVACHEFHKQFEDEFLFTEFSGLEEKGNWPVSVYEKEHEKITHWIKRLEQDINALVELELDQKQKRLNIIALIDREKSFKGLCEHHEEREEDAMLPALDKQTAADWRESIINEFSAKWHELITQQKNTIREVVDTWE